MTQRPPLSKTSPFQRRIRRFIPTDDKAEVDNKAAELPGNTTPAYREFRGMLGDGSEVYLRIEGNWDHTKIDDLIQYLETIRNNVTRNK